MSTPPQYGAWPILFLLACGLCAAPAAAQTARSMDVAGRYSIWRGEDKDTGCMLTLEARAGAGGYRAQLAPACRDNGMVIFDPVGWSLDRGRLVLTARKGHKAHFAQQGHNVWARDPHEGKALILKPIAKTRPAPDAEPLEPQ